MNCGKKKYGIGNIDMELNVLKNMDVAELIKDSVMFYPSMKTVFAILLAQPCITCRYYREVFQYVPACQDVASFHYE